MCNYLHNVSASKNKNIYIREAVGGAKVESSKEIN